MTAALTVTISILALSFSLFVFVDSRRKDQRDLFLRLHQLLNDADMQRGRYLLFHKAADEASVERLSDDEWRDINRALATFNTLGLYVSKSYVSEHDVLEIWARPIVRTWKAAQPYITYRVRLQGYRPWRYFAFLAEKAQQELDNRGDSSELKVWRRPTHTLPNSSPMTDQQAVVEDTTNFSAPKGPPPQ